jgi:hypothetical protein
MRRHITASLPLPSYCYTTYRRDATDSRPRQSPSLEPSTGAATIVPARRGRRWGGSGRSVRLQGITDCLYSSFRNESAPSRPGEIPMPGETSRSPNPQDPDARRPRAVPPPQNRFTSQVLTKSPLRAPSTSGCGSTFSEIRNSSGAKRRSGSDVRGPAFGPCRSEMWPSL